MQSIYVQGFRNACIYLRPAGWAVIAARGALYDINVKDPGKVSSGINFIKVDSKKIKGNMI